MNAETLQKIMNDMPEGSCFVVRGKDFLEAVALMLPLSRLDQPPRKSDIDDYIRRLDNDGEFSVTRSLDRVDQDYIIRRLKK